jgi:diguanylate cyclase (GGDEF)-like protein
MDLDNFKEVNDELGHASGDDLLIQVSERMQACIRETDVLARFGGDEFVVLGDDFADSNDVSDCARRLTSCVEEPFNLGGRMVTVGMSVGMAIARAAMTAEEVLDNADRAMYKAKRKEMGSTPERSGRQTAY